MPTCFLVLGTPRSGTSCVAGILSRLGVFMGSRLLDADAMNPTGYYQDVDFEELFDGLYEWMPVSIKATDFPASHFRSLIANRCALGVDWGVKFKHAAMVLPLFVQACSMPVKAIVMQRPLAASVASLSRMMDQPGDPSPLQVIQRARAAAQAVIDSGIVPTLSVDFNALITNPAATVANIAAFVGKPASDVAVFVDSSLRNY